MWCKDSLSFVDCLESDSVGSESRSGIKCCGFAYVEEDCVFTGVVAPSDCWWALFRVPSGGLVVVGVNWGVFVIATPLPGEVVGRTCGFVVWVE